MFLNITRAVKGAKGHQLMVKTHRLEKAVDHSGRLIEMSGLQSRVRINENEAPGQNLFDRQGATMKCADAPRAGADFAAADLPAALPMRLAQRAGAPAASPGDGKERKTSSFARGGNDKLILLGGGGKKLQNLLQQQIAAGRMSAARKVGAGGLLVAASEMLFAPGRTFGATLYLGAFNAPRTDALLFGGRPGRVLVAASANDAPLVVDAAARAGLAATLIGNLNDEPTLELLTDRVAASWDVAALREGWETSLGSARARPERAS